MNTEKSKKGSRITNSERVVAANQTANILKEIKLNKAEMVRVSIDKRTSIELPASLTQEERNERVAVYMRTHNL